MAGDKEVQTELSALKEKYGKDCRILSGVGDIAHMVDIKLPTITIKFQLSANYPKEPPEIILRTKTLPPTSVETLEKFLHEQAKETITLGSVIEAADKWLNERELGEALETVEPTSRKEKNKKGKNKGKGKKETEIQEKKPSKKPPMKTSEDVISRILWDDSLQSECFTIGYIDRFVGITEKIFTAFSWEDLASVDYDTLAIPKHRIEYFKYKDLIVWNKTKRLDNVFGSTGSGKTIHEVIDNYTEELAQSGFSKESSPNKSEQSDDDDVEIDLGEQKSLSTQFEGELRPTHFICVRITDEEIIDSVEAMQEVLLERESRYAECCIPPKMLHVTLCTLGLDNQDKIDEAADFLRESKDELSTVINNKFKIHIDGVDNFYDRVVYGKVQANETFQELASMLRNMLQEKNIEIRDRYDFQPHMTIMKTSRPVSRQIGSKKVPSAIYSDFLDMEFGSQYVNNLYLCKMSTQSGPDGFYQSPAKLHFFDLKKTADDEYN